MRLCLFNARSMRNKLHHIIETLLEFELDILCLTETWLYPSDIDIVRAALPKSFSIAHVPRASAVGTQGGGVALIYTKAISSMRHVTRNSAVSSYELMEVVFTCHQQTTHIFIVYRPGHPGTDRAFMEEFGSFLDSLLEVGGKIVICGDFNYWIDDPSSKPFSAEFVELLDLSNFDNFVSFPTHLSGHTLDLILAPSGCDYVKQVEPLPIDSNLSDHALIFFNLELRRPQAIKKSITFRRYHNVDHEGIVNNIEHTLNNADTASLTAEELTARYNEFFHSVEDEYMPQITKEILEKADAPWYDQSIAVLRRQRRAAERRWRRLRSDTSRQEYVAARRAVGDQVLLRKTEHYGESITSCRGNTKQLFHLLNGILGRDSPMVMPSSVSNSRLASEFAQFFQSKVARIREQLDSVPDQDDYSVEFQVQHPAGSLFLEFRPVEESNILQYVRELNKTYCSLDPINVSKIAIAYESAAPFIAILVNKFFSECNFVRSEKLALWRPLLKKVGLDKEDKNSYRPVSNLSFLSKVVERAILDQLLPFLEQNDIVPKCQSAYRQFHSTETALCRIYNDLVNCTCSGGVSLLVLLDLSAAFDTVDHDMLLDDLYFYGIRDDAYLLLKSYLTNRFQRASVGSSLSELVHLQFGVPQGSVLGPILFTLYTSSLAGLLEAHGVDYHFYADDTQVYVRMDSVEDTKDKMLILLQDIRIWMKRRKLMLNDGKTEIIIVKGNLKSNLDREFGTLEVSNTHLHPSVSARNLGIILDSKLSFKDHINSVVKCCNFHIRNLYAVRRFLDRESLISLVHSFIVSRVDYCNSLFLGLPNYLLRKLQSIINKSARLIFSLAPRVPTTSYLIELHWLPIKARIEFKICLIVFKALKFNQPKYIVDLLAGSVGGTHVALRSSDDPYHLYEPRAVGERVFAERSFVYTAPRLYNRLPMVVKRQTSLEGFKTQLKSFLFSRVYDTVNCTVSEAYRL